MISDNSLNNIVSGIKTFVYKGGVPTLTTAEKSMEKEPGVLPVIFPNPSNGKNITIDYNKTVLSEVTIIDVAGREVCRDKVLLGNRLQLPVKLEAGYYIVNIEVEGKTMTEKLVVQ